MLATRPATRTRHGLIQDMLTLDGRTGPAIAQLIYWAGLALLALAVFAVVGATVGVVIRSGAIEGVLLAIPVLAIGLLVVGALGLIWRGACEFFLAVFLIADDLRVLRDQSDVEAAGQAIGRE